MKKKIFVLMIFCFMVKVVVAEDYDLEVNGRVSDTDVNVYSFNIRRDYTDYSIDVISYFDPISTEGKPLAEAAFLSRGSNFNFGVDRSEQIDDYDTTLKLGVEWFSKDTNLYFALDYQYTEEDFGDDQSSQATIGFLPADGLLISTTFDDGYGHSPNLAVKYVKSFDSGKAVNLYGNLIDGDNATQYTLGFDYYLSPVSSLGFEYVDFSDSPRSTPLETIFRAKHFLGESIYVLGFYTNRNTGVSESDTYGVEMGFRF